MSKTVINPGSSTGERIGTKVWENKKLTASMNAMAVRVYDTGYAEVRNTWHSEASALPFTRIYVVQEGNAWISDAEQTFRMEPNMVYIIPAGVACAYHCDSFMHKLYFHLNVYKSDHYDLLSANQQIGCFSVDPDFVNRLLRHYQGEGYRDAAMLQAELLRLLGMFLQRFQPAALSSRDYSDVVSKTLDYIHRHLSAKLRNEALAERFFVSRTYLTDRFRREVGVSLGKYIDDQLMQEAQLRLCRTDDSIRTISLDLGFSDQFYFSRRFKQLCGLTPLQYRKQNR